MKTLTEFDGFRLKNALSKKTELTTAGKTAEELPAALGEELKLEGDKLTHFLAALEVAEARPDGIKRVVVFSVDEGKSAPKGALQKGDKWYLAEYFASAPTRQGRNNNRDDRGGRGKGKGKGKGRGGRDRGDRRGGGGGRGERPEANAAAGTSGEAGKEGGERRPRRRPPRGPRREGGEGKPAAAAKPSGPPNVVPNKVAAKPTAEAPAQSDGGENKA